MPPAAPQFYGRPLRWPLGLLCAAVIGASLIFLSPGDPHFRTVRKLVSQHSTYRSYESADLRLVAEVSQLGPAAYPALGRLLRDQDRLPDRLYDRLRSGAPAWLRRVLPERQSKTELSQRAKALIGPLGPSAARGLIPEIAEVLRRENRDPLSDVELLRCLYWSIPESPKAVAALADFVSRPGPGRMLFGMVDADAIWPHVPSLAPGLLQWLRHVDHVRDAAQGLGAMRTNATLAVPDLIDVYRNGVAGNPPDFTSHVQLPPGSQPLNLNRAAAIGALGKIGSATPDVLATLLQAAQHPSPMIRAMSGSAIAELGTNALPILPALLRVLDTTNRLVLEYQLEAIGQMGSAATSALPVLRHWSDPAHVAALPEPERLGYAIRWFEDPLPLPGGAAAALVAVAPDEAKGMGALIAQSLQPGPNNPGGLQAPNRLRRLRPLAGEIVQALEAHFDAHEQWLKNVTALQVLCLDPSHGRARALLLEAMKNTEPPTMRAQAAAFLWRATGQTDGVLETLEETIQTVKSNDDQPPLNFAAELGPAAKALAPRIQPFLLHEDWSLRQIAGKALRAIDPSALPPIREK